MAGAGALTLASSETAAASGPPSRLRAPPTLFPTGRDQLSDTQCSQHGGAWQGGDERKSSARPALGESSSSCTQGAQRTADSHRGSRTILPPSIQAADPAHRLCWLLLNLTRHELQETGFIFSTQVSLQGLESQ